MAQPDALLQGQGGVVQGVPGDDLGVADGADEVEAQHEAEGDHADGGVVEGAAALEGDAEVVPLGLQLGDDAPGVGPLHAEGELALAAQGEVLEVAVDGGAVVVPAFAHDLLDPAAHGHEGGEAGLGGVDGGEGADQGLVDEPLDDEQGPGRLGPLGQVEHVLGGLHVEAAAEDAELDEGGLLPGLQELPGPAQGGVDGAVAVGQVAAAAPQAGGVGRDLAQEGLGGQHVGEAGGHLDGEGEAVDGVEEGVEAGAVDGPVGAQPEELGRLVGGQGAEAHDLLAGEVEGLAAGHQGGELGAGGGGGEGEGGDAVDGLLGVVEQEQEGAAQGESAGEGGDVVGDLDAQAEGGGDGADDVGDVGGLGEVAEPDLAGLALGEVAADLAGEPGLADAAGADEGDEAAAPPEGLAELLRLAPAADEGVGLGAEVVASHVQGAGAFGGDAPAGVGLAGDELAEGRPLSAQGAQALGEVGGGLDAVGGVAGEAGAEGDLEAGVDGGEGVQGAACGEVLGRVDDAEGVLLPGGDVEGASAEGDLEQGDAEGEEVGPLVDGLAAELLGGDVADGAFDGAGGPAAAGQLGGAGEAEVGEVGPTGAVDEDVAGLDVLVHEADGASLEAQGVGVVEGVAELQAELDDGAGRQGAAEEEVVGGAAVDALHGDVDEAVEHADVVDVDDVGVVQAGAEAGLVQEGVVAVGAGLEEDLERDGLAETGGAEELGAEDAPAAAGAEDLGQLVPAPKAGQVVFSPAMDGVGRHGRPSLNDPSPTCSPHTVGPRARSRRRSSVTMARQRRSRPASLYRPGFLTTPPPSRGPISASLVGHMDSTCSAPRSLTSDRGPVGSVVTQPGRHSQSRASLASSMAASSFSRPRARSWRMARP